MSEKDIPTYPSQSLKPRNASPARFTTTGRFLFFLAAISAAGYFQFRQPAQNNTLQASYVLCSHPDDGNSIYTVDKQNSKARCLVVADAEIVAVGQPEEIDLHTDGHAFPVHYIPKGSVVLPGITDSHTHIMEYGTSKINPLDTAKSVEEVVALTRNWILTHPDILNDKSKILESWGWDRTLWPTKGWPTADDFEKDPITRDRPFIFQSKDGHATWVSRKTLEVNGPFPDTVAGGIIERDDNGDPTGIFIDNAAALIKSPVFSETDLRERFEGTVKDALANGLTCLHDAGFKPESLSFFKRESERRRLPIRLYGMTFFNESAAANSDHADFWAKAQPLIGNKGDRLTARSVKMYADGSLRSSGAALYEPYADDAENIGFMRLTDETLDKYIPTFLRYGWQVNIHAIGDRANGRILDAFERASKKYKLDIRALRPRLEHAQIMTPEDAARLGKLGVIASVQPTHVVDDMWYGEERLGPERVKNLYPFRTILNSSAAITLGTDFPVEGPNPFASFHAAISRVTQDGRSPHGPGGFFPEQLLTRTEALRGMTIDPAFASFTENTSGSLEKGKLADFVVISQDIMTVPLDKIMATKVLATVIDGEVVYGKI